MGWKLPLCRWPFPRLCGLPSVAWVGEITFTTPPLVEFGLRLGHRLADPSRSGRSRPAPPWSFAALQHIKPRGSTEPRALPARYVPPAGFGYPLGGLLPSRPCRLHLCRRRSWASPFGACPHLRYPSVAARVNPHTVFFHPMRQPPEWPPGPDGPRFLGFDPQMSPCRARRRVTFWRRGGSPGFSPSRARRNPPGTGFLRNSSRALISRGP